MFDADHVRDFINRKQSGRVTDETVRPLKPSANNADDMFGHLQLTDLHHLETFEEGRTLNFLSSQNLCVHRLYDGVSFASIDEALDNRAGWKFVDYHIDPDLPALVLHFLPISEKLAQAAGHFAAIINESWSKSDEKEEEPEDYMLSYDEEAEYVGILRRKYAIQLALLGEYEVFLAGEDDYGEYVRRSRSTKDPTKMRLRYVETSGSRKISKYVLTAGDSVMKHKVYYL